MKFEDLKEWSYAEFDSAISHNENEIARLQSETKTLREAKSQKILKESMPMISESKIDFSLADFQEFLQLKRKIDGDSKIVKQKKYRSKKNQSDSSGDDDSAPNIENKKISGSNY